MKKKLMILGYARHGKDTAADILKSHFDYKFESSSRFAARRIMMPYFESKGITYSDIEECYEDRVNHRKEWFDQIVAYNTPDLFRLAKEIYSVSDIYVGIRNRHEFEAAKDAGLFDFSIWVDRSKHFPPEEKFSNTITPDMADFFVDNNGTVEQLEECMCNLYYTELL